MIKKTYPYFLGILFFSLLSLSGFSQATIKDSQSNDAATIALQNDLIPSNNLTNDVHEAPLIEEPLSSLDPDFFIECILVGNPGNRADTSTLCGGITKSYGIGKYPVTAAQYCTFLNAVAVITDTHHLYDERMASDPTIASIERKGDPGYYSYSVIDRRDDFPITYVNLFSALRFCNWLEHEHPISIIAEEEDSITETGTYTLDGDNQISNPSAHATWYLPSEDEWYKAAYYQGGGVNADYWGYSTQSDWAPDNAFTTTKSANYYCDDYTNEAPPYLTRVGSSKHSPSPYGAYDMGGNVAEWVHTQMNQVNSEGFLPYVVRGGSWDAHYNMMTYNPLHSSYREGCNPLIKSNQIGFRVAANQSIFTASFIIHENTHEFDEKTFTDAPFEDSFIILLITLIAAAVAGGVILALGGFIKVIGPLMGSMLAARSAADREMLRAQGDKRPDNLLTQGTRIVLSTLLAVGIGACLLYVGLAAGPVMLVNGAAEISEGVVLGEGATSGSRLLSLFVRATPEAIKEAPLQTLSAALLGSALGTDISIDLHSRIGRIVEGLKNSMYSGFEWLIRP